MRISKKATIVPSVLLALLVVALSSVAIRAQSSQVMFTLDSASRRAQETALHALQARASGPIVVRWNQENATPVEIVGPLASAGAIARAGGPERAALSLLDSHVEIFGLHSAAVELRAIRVTSDVDGSTHVLFDRVYKGLRVFPSQLVVHFLADGAITGVNGRYHPSFDINIVPSVTAVQATEICQKLLGSVAVKEPRTELFIFGRSSSLRLAWEVFTPVPGRPTYRFVVDATTGEVLVKDSGIRR